MRASNCEGEMDFFCFLCGKLERYLQVCPFLVVGKPDNTQGILKAV